MKKGILGEGLVEVFSILLLVGILLVFYVLFAGNINYSDIPGIKEIISSEKLVSDGSITLNNLLKTPVDDGTLYEFILLNKDDEDKIKKKLNEVLKEMCSSLDTKFCLWELKINFPSKEIVFVYLNAADKKEFDKFTLTLPQYNNELVEFELTIYKKLREFGLDVL
tara:strand:- start:670 stop:1167 length:498 start_codon:yes stop_codon:yes gene_type:complete